MDQFRSVTEVLKFSPAREVALHSATVSCTWQRASSSTELWDLFSDDYSLPQRRKDRYGLEWFRHCCSEAFLPVVSPAYADVYTVPTVEKRRVWWDRSIAVDLRTAYCFLRPRELLCCGGNGGKAVFSVNVYTGTVQERGEMLQARNWAGIVKCNRVVYMLEGSHSERFLLTGERYNPASDRWQLLQCPFAKPRIGFTPAVYRNSIFCLGRKDSVEVLDPASESIRRILVQVTRYDFWSVAVVYEDHLIVISEGSIRVCEMEPLKVVETRESKFPHGIWTNCPVVRTWDTVFCLSHGKLSSGIVALNLPTLSITLFPW